MLKNFHPDELWIAPGPPTPTFEALIRQANASKIAIRERVAGQKYDFGGANFEVFAPAAEAKTASERGNDDSMVLKIAYENTSALLEGDAERRTERRIATELGPVNLLKVAHHASATSSIPELMSRIQPQFAVISVGKLNRYGHPRPEVLQRLHDAGSCVFRTDINGALSFYLDGTTLTSARWGKSGRL